MPENQKVSVSPKGQSTENTKRGRKAGGFLFPRNSLKRALEVPNAVWQNGGNPFSMLDLAPAIDMSPSSSAFVTILASSFRYGLTEGSPTTKVISLTSLGRSIVAPNADTDVNAALRKALTTPEIFKQIFDKFDTKPLPRQEVLRNTLVNPPESGGFGVPRGDVEELLKIFSQNINDYGLSQDIKGTPYLRLDRLSSVTAVELGRSDEDAVDAEIASVAIQTNQVAPPPPATIEVKVPRVFISHSKNKNILTQIKQMLEFGKFQFDIAEERETTAMPLSDKVFNIMWDCNCAIINISADTEKKQGETFGINENVIAELWGAYLHYRKRVILVIDKRLKDKLPSIMQGLTAIFYEGDELSWGDGMRLQNALSEFRNQL